MPNKGYDPNQPRNEEGEWAETAASAAKQAAGLTYVVPPRPYVKNIPFAGQDVVSVDNRQHKPYTTHVGLRRIAHSSPTDKEVMKQIARDEKAFYDVPMSTGPDEHTEVRLEATSSGWQIRYTSFRTDTKELLSDIWNDFSRCPVCRFPTISPDFEAAYNCCSTCGVEYQEPE
jgi:hypothetical protein